MNLQETLIEILKKRNYLTTQEIRWCLVFNYKLYNISSSKIRLTLKKIDTIGHIKEKSKFKWFIK